jgi:hypothetical protein
MSLSGSGHSIVNDSDVSKTICPQQGRIIRHRERRNFKLYSMPVAGACRGTLDAADYQRLFSSSAIILKATLNAGDWILFRNPFPAAKKTVGFIALDEIVGDKSKLSSGMTAQFG